MNQDFLPDLDGDLKELLASGRPGFVVPPLDRQKVLLSVMSAGVGVAVVAGAAQAGAGLGSAGAPAVPAAWFAGKATVGVAGLLVGIGLGAGGHALLQKAESTSPMPHDNSVYSNHAVTVEQVDSSADVTQPVVSAQPERPEPSGASIPRVGAGSEDLQLREERAMIDVARMAVARGEGEHAITALQRHARKYPHGQLREERDALWIRALKLSGDLESARKRENDFRQAYPDSLVAPPASSGTR